MQRVPDTVLALSTDLFFFFFFFSVGRVFLRWSLREGLPAHSSKMRMRIPDLGQTALVLSTRRSFTSVEVARSNHQYLRIY